jgi:uncharacterized surface protein with fasciclin (FAS1) repeats
MTTKYLRLAAGLAVAFGLLASACSDDASDVTADSAPADQSTAPAAAGTTAADSAMSAENDIVDTAIAAGDFTTLVAAVRAAGLEDTLRGEGPFTVFAPTDDAFAALPPGTVETLLEDPTGDLATILTYHVVPGAVLAADVVGLNGQDVATVEGDSFRVGVGGDGSVTLTDASGNDVAVVTTDIETSNGVIHVIDGVLLPG